MLEILVLIGCYLLGSIPFGFIVAKLWKGIDIRQHGSGNIGATNIMRLLGTGPAIAVFAADILKGLIPVIVAQNLFHNTAWIVILCGLTAVIGHTLSVFLNFKGGKGVATSLGVIVGLDPRIALIGFAAWVVVVAISRYVSLASIIGAISITTCMWVFHKPLEYIIFTLAATAFIIIKHKSNISRLLKGTEAKFGEKVKVDNHSGGSGG
ncbi:MAG: glycerol-3-phosphate 1-O-acyltransferase PlsY [Armatimonadota bacterium]